MGSWDVCYSCGCLVADKDKHTEWHAALALRFTPNPDVVTGPAWSGDPVPVVPAPTQAERDERALDRAALDAIVALSGQAHTDGEPWEQPTGASTAYRLGAIATRDGRTWESTIPFNVRPPGDPADPQAYRWWRDITPQPEPEPGPQPWDGRGVHYLVGVEVTHEGRTYRVRQEHTSQPDWAPPVVPALYLPL